jgi:hypothetical protein
VRPRLAGWQLHDVHVRRRRNAGVWAVRRRGWDDGDRRHQPSPDVGLPCGVREICPDGIDYKVNCDGTTGACSCFMKGAPTASMPTMACTSFDPIGALTACGFPPGQI